MVLYVVRGVVGRGLKIFGLGDRFCRDIGCLRFGGVFRRVEKIASFVIFKL